ncbi:hypothetical protein ACEPAF_1295 [Sanghuangporus sanghuang]
MPSLDGSQLMGIDRKSSMTCISPFVQLAPNHVSICNLDAIRVIYAHGNGTTKSDFYDAFFEVRHNILSTQEPYIHQHVAEFLEQWDKLCEGGKNVCSGTEGEGGWQGRLGRVWFNCMPWYNYWAVDVIGNLAFGSPFDIVRNARDVLLQQWTSTTLWPTMEIPAVKMLTDQAESPPSLGALPPWIRPLVLRLPCEASHISDGSARHFEPRQDEEGRPMSREELTEEAFAQLIAGSDTISKQLFLCDNIAANPQMQAKLQKELDEALGVDSCEDPVPTYDQVKNLRHLEAVINEGMRLHSTVGLLRVVPEGGVTVYGKSFPEGTVLSIPMYTVHRVPEVWGADADIFRPERWFERDPVKLQKSFHPFSFGPGYLYAMHPPT